LFWLFCPSPDWPVIAPISDQSRSISNVEQGHQHTLIYTVDIGFELYANLLCLL
jgi:hypothetical protein